MTAVDDITGLSQQRQAIVNHHADVENPIAVPTVLTAVNRIRMKPQQAGRTLANS
jgi:hypothetical protein